MPIDRSEQDTVAFEVIDWIAWAKFNRPEKRNYGIFAVVMAAFTEDREIIEAQQRVWDRTPSGKQLAFIAHDKGPGMFRRTMARLVKAEQDPRDRDRVVVRRAK